MFEKPQNRVKHCCSPARRLWRQPGRANSPRTAGLSNDRKPAGCGTRPNALPDSALIH